MTETPRHRLPMLSAGQAQKEVTHNEALLHVDRMLHPAVLSRALAEPPTPALAGDTYIVPVGGSGAWMGFEQQLASFDGYGWIFANPVRGCLAWIVDEAQFSVFDGGWSDGGWPTSGLRILGREVLGAPPASVAAPVGGALIDNEARAAIVALIATLRDQGVVN